MDGFSEESNRQMNIGTIDFLISEKTNSIASNQHISISNGDKLLPSYIKRLSPDCFITLNLEKVAESNSFIKINDGKYILLGKVDIDSLNELLDDEFSNEDDDYDTIGGFIFQQAGSIPEKGYNFNFKNYNFKVIEIENNRISKVMITKIPTKELK